MPAACFTRRDALLAVAALTLAGCGEAAPSRSVRRQPGDLFADLEKQYTARLGVFGVDTATNRSVAFRADAPFAYCSTHKALSVGALLRLRSMAELQRTIAIEAADVVNPSPVCAGRIGERMSWEQLCDAAIRFSDNTAANHLLAELGGPPGLQRELRGLGDRRTRCDRDEPELSSAVPGDPRDTSTARALASDLRAFVLGPVLPAGKRELLAEWLKGNTTGDTLVRAAAPGSWVVGDKTGSGGFGTRNDIAVLWPPRRPPIVLAVLSSRPAEGPHAVRDDRLVAAAADVALGALL